MGIIGQELWEQVGIRLAHANNNGGKHPFYSDWYLDYYETRMIEAVAELNEEGLGIVIDEDNLQALGRFMDWHERHRDTNGDHYLITAKE
jgi:hypothetical protein